MYIFAAVVCLGSMAATVILFLGFGAAKGAPQEAAVAALAVAVAVIPYVFFRAIQITVTSSKEEDFRRDLLRALRANEPPDEGPATIPAQQSRRTATKVVREGQMGSAGWHFQQYDDGSVKVIDPHDGVNEYASIEEAKREITWWQPK